MAGSQRSGRSCRTGPNNPEQSWAGELARQLHWNAVVYGVPGTGYLRDSAFGRGLLTTFAGVPGGSPALREIDRAIISAGMAADPGVVIMDPLAGHWSFPRAADGLHPTAAGDAWIAHTVAAILRAHGVHAAPATSGTPVICDVSVGAGKPVSATA